MTFETHSGMPSVGLLIHRIDRLAGKRFDRLAESTGMSRAQWHVIAHVAKHEGINQASLADIVGVEPISICRMVDRLEALGFVERRPDPADRRARLLYATELAHTNLKRTKAIIFALFDEALEGFGDAEEELLLALLERIEANLLAKTDEDAPTQDSNAAPSSRGEEDQPS